MSYRETNPFSPPSSLRRRRSVFDTHSEARSQEGVAAELSFRRKEKEKLGGYERLHTVLELNDYLQHRPGGENACTSRFDCDPWKYEPMLLEDLVQAVTTGSPSEKIDDLRGLIRAGSWMTYERNGQRGALDLLRQVMRQEQDDWTARIRQADPDTSRELKQDMAEALQELEQAAKDLEAGKTGTDLEASVRAIENLNAYAWTSLKKHVVARGEDLGSAKLNPLTQPLVRLIQELRPVRDLLYYRRIYPKWAELSLVRTGDAKPLTRRA